MRLRGMGTCTTALVVLAMVAAVAAPGALAPTGAAGADPPVFEGPVPRADCGPGSDPEPPGALQGEVTQRDRDSGRSTRPYTCNLELVGNDANSPGAEWQDSWYGSCAYYDTKLQSGAGTQVVDAADPTKPVRTTALTSPAMLDPWESLSVNQKRGLLAGVYTNALFGPLYFDVYDVSKDCTHPELKASLPINTVGHEGEWAPDGLTYYGAGAVITAIDVTDPASPRPVGHIDTATTHGLSISDDGNRAYLAGQPIGSSNSTNGLTIVDTSQIQARNPAPHTPVIGAVTWDDGAFAQAAIPVTIKGHPYVIFFDEGPLGMGNGQGATRIIDVADEAHPRVISKLKLEIQMPANGSRAAETGTSGFGYNTHYCGVPQRTDPGIAACSNFESGMRVFDIRDPYHPREIAYFNPGGTGKASPSGSQDGQNPVTSGYTSARVRLIPDRGEAWFTDQNKGLFITRFTNGVWPFRDSGASTPADLGLPSPAGPKTTATCVRKRSVSVRLRSPFRRSARRATVMVNGRAVKRVRGRALRRPIAVRLPSGHSVVRIVVQTRSGKRLVQTRGYTRCTGKRR